MQQAIHWFQKASDQGNADAQYSLALLVGAGKGLPEDSQRAGMLLQNAARQGHKQARVTLEKYGQHMADFAQSLNEPAMQQRVLDMAGVLALVDVANHTPDYERRKETVSQLRQCVGTLTSDSIRADVEAAIRAFDEQDRAK